MEVDRPFQECAGTHQEFTLQSERRRIKVVTMEQTVDDQEGFGDPNTPHLEKESKKRVLAILDRGTFIGISRRQLGNICIGRADRVIAACAVDTYPTFLPRRIPDYNGFRKTPMMKKARKCGKMM